MEVLGIHFEITTACNLRCEHCYNAFQDRSSRVPPLRTSDWLRVAQQAVKIGIKNVVITGGEPLTRLEVVVELCKFLTQHQITTALITNATLATTDASHLLKESGVSEVVVSLHAANPELHDRITGKEGSFTETLRGVRALLQSGLQVSINMVVTRKNLSEIVRVGRLVASLGVNSFSATRFVPPWGSQEMECLLLDRAEVRKIFSCLRRIKEETGIRVDTRGCYPLCLSAEFQVLPRTHLCSAGISGGVTVGSRGELRPCALMPLNYGSVLAEDLSSLLEKMQEEWEGDDFLPKVCHSCPALHKYCNGGCRVTAYYATGDLRGLDIHASPCSFFLKQEVTR